MKGFIFARSELGKLLDMDSDPAEYAIVVIAKNLDEAQEILRNSGYERYYDADKLIDIVGMRAIICSVNIKSGDMFPIVHHF